jgi:hypothetical protein
MEPVQSGSRRWLRKSSARMYHVLEQRLRVYEPARPRQGIRCAPCQFDEGWVSRNTSSVSAVSARGQMMETVGSGAPLSEGLGGSVST